MSVNKIAETFGLKKFSAFFNITKSITLNGKKFNVPIVNNLGFGNLTLESDFFVQIFNGLKLKENDCFVDIGVNVGQTLLKFRSSKDNTYFGFEPNPSCVYYLNSLITANAIRNATIVPVGLSSKSEIAKFYTKGKVDQAGTIVDDLRPGLYSVEDVQYVPVFSFDSLDVIGDRNIGFMKIDVEGAELEVLSGMTETIKKHKPAILCEILDCHTEENIASMQARVNKLVAHIQSLDYKIFRVIHENGNITPEPISEVKLRKWVPESANLNDYLFLPGNTSFSDIIQL